MNDKTEIKPYSNIRAVAAGIFIAYAANLILVPFVRYLLISLLDNTENKLTFNYFYFANLFKLSTEISDLQFFVIHFFVLIAIIVLLEIGNILFLKTGAGFKRFLLISFQIFNIGYLLFWIIKGSVLLIVDPFGTNDVVQTSNFFNMDENGKIVFAFALLIFSLIYSNSCLGRLKKYLVLPQKT